MTPTPIEPSWSAFKWSNVHDRSTKSVGNTTKQRMVQAMAQGNHERDKCSIEHRAIVSSHREQQKGDLLLYGPLLPDQDDKPAAMMAEETLAAGEDNRAILAEREVT
jgi:uncharacterized protein YciI